MHTSTTLLSLLLSASSLAAPLTQVRRATEDWTVTEMKIHFMGRDTGLPGNTWPDSAKFNSTNDFTVAFPDGSTASCGASWKQPDYPTGVVPCATAGVSFQLGPYSEGATFSEGVFSLSVFRNVVDSQTGEIHSWSTAPTPITDNSPGNSTSYLTCLGGPPLDGVRCNLHGQMSVQKDLVLEGTS